MEPILVTGGAGFIGAHTCKELAAHGFQPIAFDNLSRGHRDALQWGPFVQGDILKHDDLDSAFKRYPFRGPCLSVAQPLAYYQNNVSGAYQRARRDGPARGRYHSIFKFVRAYGVDRTRSASLMATDTKPKMKINGNDRTGGLRVSAAALPHRRQHCLTSRQVYL